jgi:glycosyltransferase involved in cell wall biosynthesis
VIFSNGFPVNLLTTAVKPLLGRTPRLILREVNVLDVLLRSGLARVVLRQVAQRTFRAADAIICQSRFMQQDLQQGLHLDPGKLVTIFNPVDFERIGRLAAEENPLEGQGPGPHIVGVGQLAKKKGFDRLIRALPALLKREPSAELWLLGEGEEREVLERQARELGLGERVHLVGGMDNPYAWMRNADLFVLSSRHEGTPNVLLEAIACEAPTVVLDHPGGTREVMQRVGQEWRIVSDLSDWDRGWFARPPRSALLRAREFLDVTRVTRQYLAVLEGVEPLRAAA